MENGDLKNSPINGNRNTIRRKTPSNIHTQYSSAMIANDEITNVPNEITTRKSQASRNWGTLSEGRTRNAFVMSIFSSIGMSATQAEKPNQMPL